jgi:hypothetical protein
MEHEATSSDKCFLKEDAFGRVSENDVTKFSEAFKALQALYAKKDPPRTWIEDHELRQRVLVAEYQELLPPQEYDIPATLKDFVKEATAKAKRDANLISGAEDSKFRRLSASQFEMKEPSAHAKALKSYFGWLKLSVEKEMNLDFSAGGNDYVLLRSVLAEMERQFVNDGVQALFSPSQFGSLMSISQPPIDSVKTYRHLTVEVASERLNTALPRLDGSLKPTQVRRNFKGGDSHLSNKAGASKIRKDEQSEGQREKSGKRKADAQNSPSNAKVSKTDESSSPSKFKSSFKKPTPETSSLQKCWWCKSTQHSAKECSHPARIAFDAAHPWSSMSGTLDEKRERFNSLKSEFKTKFEAQHGVIKPVNKTSDK